MKKFNRLELRRYKAEKLFRRKEEHRRFKKVFKKALLEIASLMIGLELASDNFENYPRGVINFLDNQNEIEL